MFVTTSKDSPSRDASVRSESSSFGRFHALSSFLRHFLPLSSRRVLLVVALMLLPVFAPPALAAIPASERAVLIALYNGTGGDGWIDNTGWKTAGSFSAAGTECTNWYGVTCDGAGDHVTKLDLWDNNLTGALPATLNQLTALENFDVGVNNLTGSIPSLTGLTALEYFYVDYNNLTGSIPSLAGLTNLVGFYANNNKLTGSIPSLTGLTALQYFVASNNQLTGSIPSLTGLTALEYFYVDNNQLTGSLPSLANLSNLAQFVASHNRLTGTIPTLTGVGLTGLRYFGVSDNLLTGSIPDLTGLSALQNFNVSFNRLSGDIPASVSGLTDLWQFLVFNNQLTGAPPAAPAYLGYAQLCPNKLSAPSASDTDWDAAVNNWSGAASWFDGCTATPVAVTVSGTADIDYPPAVSGGTPPQLTLTCIGATPTPTGPNAWSVTEGASCVLGTTGGTPPAGYAFDNVTFSPSTGWTPAIDLIPGEIGKTSGVFTVPKEGVLDLLATVTLKAGGRAPTGATTAVPMLDPKALLMLAMFVLLLGGIAVGGAARMR